ncbi:hypothetical protein [Oceanobacillus chungangensis]|uniref:DUF2178 domain-containing protein n=1 Tax=Oceanobacillus chungangensis TaxID=1229152 RepID=A0A3D8PMT8_9BACI|nr:hypothetical protein [Oceanobacillus chungangensis]RDW17294.1 hypothetical protein CWR45_12950 [Oceanobacillus chungangensis]
MQVNFLTVIIGSVISFAVVCLITEQIQWGIIVGLLIGVGSAKWLRVKKNKASDEIEYDERVNNNIKKSSFQTFSIANLLLLIYLLYSELILNNYAIKTSYLIIYLSIIFILSYYVVPLIVKRK